MKAVCYYVSGHGLGHASRATQVMSRIPPQIPLIVKTRAPEDFIRRESGRPLTYLSEQYDTGTWQASNTEIDWERTLKEACRVQALSDKGLPEEADFLRRERVGVVVSDVPPPAFQAAAAAGVPSIAVVNFTWVEIFRKLTRTHPEARRLIRRYEDQYQLASVALRPGFNFSMPYFPVRRDIPLIARTGKLCRSRLLTELRCNADDRLVLLYFGSWGNGELQWDRLRTMSGYTFVAFTPLPKPVHYLDPNIWHFPDVVRSVDTVLAKPGYGTLGECLANGTPVVYYPRPEFAEYPHLRRALLEWGGAVQISRAAFTACRWQDSLEAAQSLNPPAVQATGAEAVVQEILRAMGTR